MVVDGFENSQRVGEHTVCLARDLGAELFILGVVNEHLALRKGIHHGSIMAELERGSETAARGIEKMAAESGVRYRKLLVAGRPWQIIVQETEADCVVMGSLGTAMPLEEWLVDHKMTGGTFRKVLGHIGCPVLLVR